MDYQVKSFYFSATGNTKKVVNVIAEELFKHSRGKAVQTVDFTLPAGRAKPAVFGKNDLVVAGIPVYAGRIPNLLLNYLSGVQGNGALAVAVVTYGNRHYDDALSELRGLLDEHGFHVIAGGAFVGEHSFSKVMGGGRPDQKDLAAARRFAEEISRKVEGGTPFQQLKVPGNWPPLPYYKPRDAHGGYINILKVVPKTKDTCTQCGLCAKLCPMGSIDPDDPFKMTGICIKCGACVKSCPVQAKYFDDPGYLFHKEDLEEKFTTPKKEPECYL